MKLPKLCNNTRAGLCAIVLAAVSVLAGCGKREEKPYVAAVPGACGQKGFINFHYSKGNRNYLFRDEGYDGTLDRVYYHEKGSEPVTITDPEKLKEFQALYVEVREKAADPE